METSELMKGKQKQWTGNIGMWNLSALQLPWPPAGKMETGELITHLRQAEEMCRIWACSINQPLSL